MLQISLDIWSKAHTFFKQRKPGFLSLPVQPNACYYEFFFKRIYTLEGLYFKKTERSWLCSTWFTWPPQLTENKIEKIIRAGQPVELLDIKVYLNKKNLIFQFKKNDENFNEIVYNSIWTFIWFLVSLS